MTPASVHPVSAKQQPASNAFAPAPVNPNVARELNVPSAYQPTRPLEQEGNIFDEIGSGLQEFLNSLFGNAFGGEAAAQTPTAPAPTPTNPSAPGLPIHSAPAKQQTSPQTQPAPTAPTMVPATQLGEMFGNAAAQGFVPGSATPDYQLPQEFSGVGGFAGQNPMKF
jgi:hypothetical protein